MTSMLDTALAYAAYGWHIFPLHTINDDGCTCGRALDECSSPGKHPRTRNGLKDATSRDTAIRAWWTRWPDANIGLRTGQPSQIVVVDIDLGHHGFDTLVQLEAANGELITKEAETGSGGAHLYYQHPGQEIGNTAGKLGPGLDTRGDGGYVVAPPSRHASGGHYHWCTGHKRIEPLPDWLLSLLTRQDPAPDTSRPNLRLVPQDASDRYWLAALKGEVDNVRNAIQGTRNHTLNRAAFNMGQLVVGGAPLESITQLLETAGLAAGMPAPEVRRTVASGLAGGMKAPRSSVA